MCLLLIIASVVCANDPAYDDPTSIWYTARKGEVDKVKALVDNDSALLDAEDKWRRTPLLYSAKAGHHEVVRYLLSNGSKSANLMDVYGYAPVHWAAMYNKVRALEAFAEHNVDLDVRDEQDRTPLMCAMGNVFSNSPKHEETVRFLISKGVDVNATDKNGFSALHWGATLTGKQKSVAELLKLSTDINLNVTDKEGGTALHKAAGFGRTDIAELLVAYGADPHVKNNHGMNALDEARKCVVEARRESITRVLERAMKNRK